MVRFLLLESLFLGDFNTSDPKSHRPTESFKHLSHSVGFYSSKGLSDRVSLRCIWSCAFHTFQWFFLQFYAIPCKVWKGILRLSNWWRWKSYLHFWSIFWIGDSRNSRSRADSNRPQAAFRDRARRATMTVTGGPPHRKSAKIALLFYLRDQTGLKAISIVLLMLLAQSFFDHWLSECFTCCFLWPAYLSLPKNSVILLSSPPFVYFDLLLALIQPPSMLRSPQRIPTNLSHLLIRCLHSTGHCTELFCVLFYQLQVFLPFNVLRDHEAEELITSILSILFPHDRCLPRLLNSSVFVRSPSRVSFGAQPSALAWLSWNLNLIFAPKMFELKSRF